MGICHIFIAMHRACVVPKTLLGYKVAMAL